MAKKNVVITETGFPAAPRSESIIAPSSGEISVTTAFRVINQMVADCVVKNYALGGAMAAFFYIEPDTTYDMDLFCLLAHESEASGLVLLDPIYSYLRDKGYKARGIGVMIAGTEVQFLLPSDSLGEASIEHAKTFDFQGVLARVMTPEYLIAHMLKTGRRKDRTRIGRFIEAQAFDPAILSEILSEHGLEEKYAVLESLEHQ